jgi:hypothetical protein
MPVFDGLFKRARDNNIIQDLLFELCTWHALAKLRPHDEVTTTELRASTKRLGVIMRLFHDEVCKDAPTTDLPKEAEAKKAWKAKEGTKGKAKDTDKPEKSFRPFNLITYKMHALSHYPDFIEHISTTDNYNTQTVSFSFLNNCAHLM